jgi:predicted nucleic acid-binding protein
MRIFLDCDVLLDVALNRKPFAASSGKLLDRLETEQRAVAMAWHSIGNIYYIAAKLSDSQPARELIADLCSFIHVVPASNPAHRVPHHRRERCQGGRPHPRRSPRRLLPARFTLEAIVHWLYRHDPSLRMPYDHGLGALLHEPSFQNLLPEAVLQKARAIRKVGNQAVHNLQPSRAQDALDAELQTLRKQLALAEHDPGTYEKQRKWVMEIAMLLEDMRPRLRGLVPLLEKQARKIVYTDIRDAAA